MLELHARVSYKKVDGTVSRKNKHTFLDPRRVSIFPRPALRDKKQKVPRKVGVSHFQDALSIVTWFALE